MSLPPLPRRRSLLSRSKLSCNKPEHNLEEKLHLKTESGVSWSPGCVFRTERKEERKKEHKRRGESERNGQIHRAQRQRKRKGIGLQVRAQDWDPGSRCDSSSDNDSP